MWAGAPTLRSITRSRCKARIVAAGRSRPAAIRAARAPMQPDEERGGEPTEPERAEQKPFEHAQDASENAVGDDALEQRERGDVRDRVSDPDDGERRERDRIADDDADDGERDAEEHDAEREVGGESPRVASTSATNPPTKPPTPSAALR